MAFVDHDKMMDFTALVRGISCGEGVLDKGGELPTGGFCPVWGQSRVIPVFMQIDFSVHISDSLCLCLLLKP